MKLLPVDLEKSLHPFLWTAVRDNLGFQLKHKRKIPPILYYSELMIRKFLPVHLLVSFWEGSFCFCHQNSEKQNVLHVTYLLGNDFNMCSQHSGSFFCVPLHYNRNANVALK